MLGCLNSYTFNELHPSRQRKFNALPLRFYILSESANNNTRADIFKRINANGKTLTEAEMRKGVFMNNQFYQFILARIIHKNIWRYGYKLLSLNRLKTKK